MDDGRGHGAHFLQPLGVRESRRWRARRPWTAISIAPFTLGLLQYALEVDAGTAGEPEDVVLHDHVLQGLGVVWLAVITVAVFF